jgi:hypothetical protein
MTHEYAVVATGSILFDAIVLAEKEGRRAVDVSD